LGGVLSALAAAAVAGALLGQYRRVCLRRKVTATPGKDTTDVPESADSVEKLNGSANKLKRRLDDDHESSV